MARHKTELDARLPPIDMKLVRPDDCKQLWCAVLIRALLDLQESEVDTDRSWQLWRSEYERERAEARREAYNFFFNKEHDEDFQIVCQSAGFDPRIVREKARQSINPMKLVRHRGKSAQNV